MDKERPNKPQRTYINPLWIISGFLGVAETVVGVAATQTIGLVQLVLTWFAVLFPPVVLILFFFVLITRPEVFYGPKDYAEEMDPLRFVTALQARSITRNQVRDNLSEPAFEKIERYQELTEFLGEKLESYQRALQTKTRQNRMIRLPSVKSKQLTDERIQEQQLRRDIQLVTYQLYEQARISSSFVESITQIESATKSSRYYELVRATYLVGEERDDKVIRDFRVVSQENVMWMENVEFGVTTPNVQISNFDAIGLQCEMDFGTVLVWSTQESSSIIKGKLVFVPPLQKGEKANIQLRAEIPGTWDPLRNDGRDIGVYRLDKPANLLEISIILPKQLSDAELHPISPEGAGVVNTSENSDGQKILVWQIPHAQIAEYQYEVKRPLSNGDQRLS